MKAQMEMLGLAFVFFLIIMGFLIYVNLTPKEKEDTINDYLEPKIASAFTDAFLHTTVNCGKYGKKQIRELMIDCISSNLNGYPPQLCEEDNVFMSDTEMPIDITTEASYGQRQSTEEYTSCQIIGRYLQVLPQTKVYDPNDHTDYYYEPLWGKPFFITTYRDTDIALTDDNPFTEPNDVLSDYLKTAYGEPPISANSDIDDIVDEIMHREMLDGEKCTIDKRHRMSRQQPLPLNNGGNMIIEVGICY